MGYYGNRSSIDKIAAIVGLRHGKVDLDKKKWCLGNQKYPLYKWSMIPYKSPVNLLKENSTFNYYLSRIRILS